MEQFLNSYYENNAKKLHSIINKIFNKYYGGTSEKDMDEYYGIGTDVLTEIWKKNTYNPSKGDFDAYVYNSLRMAFIDEFKRQNRDKRKAKVFLLDENGDKVVDEKNGMPMKISVSDISLDAPIKSGETTTYGDMIQSDFSIDDQLSEAVDGYKDNIEAFLKGLSDVQKKICSLIMKGYEARDIKRVLNITDRQYKDHWSVITSYDKKRILFKEDNNVEDERMNTMVMEENVNEKYKNTSYSIDSISKQLKKKRIRDDHILQRHSGQWKGFAKSELVSDILRGKSLTQIIISEEIKNGIKMQWLIDGKQRCTTLDDYLHDGFSISKNVKNYNINYQAPKVDYNGNEVLNEDGFTDMVWKTFDIRGKKFSQLPEELQDIFRDRQIPVLYNMDCTKKDIADDIARFNRSRAMNTAQNGWLGLEEGFAEFVENIAKMQFFQPEFIGSSYTDNNRTSGMIRRIIVESIMVSDFIDDFCSFDKMCEFLSEEASDSNFTEFYSMVERLTLISSEETAALFNARDSFLWFGLFSEFSKLDMEDAKFGEFMIEFQQTLYSKKINKESFDDILKNKKATKDKSVVFKKINHLKKLMFEYLGVNDVKSDFYDSIEEFISETLNLDLDVVNSDMDLYNESLDLLLENTVGLDSKLRSDENRPSLLAMIAYSYKEDKDLDNWMEEYAKNNNTYLLDKRKNFLHMKRDFEEFSMNENRKSA